MVKIIDESRVRSLLNDASVNLFTDDDGQLLDGMRDLASYEEIDKVCEIYGIPLIDKNDITQYLRHDITNRKEIKRFLYKNDKGEHIYETI
jgi:hypothetical protein